MERNIKKENVYMCVSESHYSRDWHHIVNYTSITKKKERRNQLTQAPTDQSEENSRIQILDDCNRL